MSLLGADEIRHLAMLAGLDVDESETESLTLEIAAILEYVSQLGEAKDPDRAREAAESLTTEAVRLRTDEVSTAAPEETLGSMAPEFERGLFLVPRLESVGDG